MVNKSGRFVVVVGLASGNASADNREMQSQGPNKNKAINSGKKVSLHRKKVTTNPERVFGPVRSVSLRQVRSDGPNLLCVQSKVRESVLETT